MSKRSIFGLGLGLILLGAAPLRAFVSIPYNDPSIKYFGRWDTSSGSYARGYWSGAYLKIRFSGPQIIMQVNLGVTACASVDNGSIQYWPMMPGLNSHNIGGSQGQIHELKLIMKYNDSPLLLENLQVMDGESFYPPDLLCDRVTFYGDSISAGFLAAGSGDATMTYAWKAAQALGAECSIIARSGISLSTNLPYGLQAMNISYQYIQDPPQGAYTAFNFALDPARVVGVVLGGNDASASVLPAAYQTACQNFLAALRLKYPSASIFAVSEAGLYAAQIQAAVTALSDPKIFFADSAAWLIPPPSADFQSDNTHPSPQGHDKIAAQMVSLIQANAPYTCLATRTATSTPFIPPVPTLTSTPTPPAIWTATVSPTPPFFLTYTSTPFASASPTPPSFPSPTCPLCSVSPTPMLPYSVSTGTATPTPWGLGYAGAQAGDKIVAFPNPLRLDKDPGVVFAFAPAGNTNVEVFDRALGKVVILPDRSIDQARGFAFWDGKNGNGTYVPSGMYFVVVRNGAGKKLAKFTVLR